MVVSETFCKRIWPATLGCWVLPVLRTSTFTIPELFRSGLNRRSRRRWMLPCAVIVIGPAPCDVNREQRGNRQNRRVHRGHGVVIASKVRAHPGLHRSLGNSGAESRIRSVIG